MSSIGKLMKQAQRMQAQMEQVQAALNQRTVEATSGGGAVKVVARCDGTIAAIKIDPQALNPSDAQLFIKVTRPHLLICGPGIQANGTAMKGFADIKPKLDLLLLPSDFSAAEAGQAGTDLVNRLRSILPNEA